MHPGDELQFSKKTVAKFAKDILPNFENKEYITVTGSDDLKAILPPDAHFLLKLDYRENNILCITQVQYGDTKYEVNHNYAENNKRDIEQELAVQEQINTYFSKYQHNQ